MHLMSAVLPAFCVSHRYTEQRDVVEEVTALFFRQPTPERSIPALSAEDSPVNICAGAHSNTEMACLPVPW